MSLTQLPRITNMAEKSKIEVYGLLNDITYVRTRCCAEDIYKKWPCKLEQPVTVGMVQFDWDIFLEGKKKLGEYLLAGSYISYVATSEKHNEIFHLDIRNVVELRGETWQYSKKAITFVDGELIGGPEEFIAWAEEKYSFEDFRPLALYLTLTEEIYKGYLNSKNHDYVFMDISIGDHEAGRLVIELFSDHVPKTCTNFKALCTGEKGISETTEVPLTYENTIFHRIVRNGWIQGGDIVHGQGNQGESIYGPVFEDENFSVPHDRRGIVGMANKGRHTNGSQFYITLQPTPWMDTKYVAFGQVIEGTETLRKMEAEETMNERPFKIIRVTKCGVLNFEF